MPNPPRGTLSRFPCTVLVRLKAAPVPEISSDAEFWQ